MNRRQRVAVVGATGVLGRPVVQQLLERGHAVCVIARFPQRARQLLGHSASLTVCAGDILEASSLQEPLQGCDAVLNLATAIPKAGGAVDWRLNDRIRREGTRNLVAAARAAGRPRYVQQSVAMLSASPLPAVLESALEMELLVQDSGLPWLILRGGLFYGPGTGRTQDIDRAARQASLRLPGQGDDWLSLVRPDDMAGAMVLSVESPLAGETLEIVDDQPVTWHELYGHVAALHGQPAPPSGGPVLLPTFRAGNARAKTVLGWSPAHPSFRTGWSAPTYPSGS